MRRECELLEAINSRKRENFGHTCGDPSTIYLDSSHKEKRIVKNVQAVVTKHTVVELFSDAEKPRISNDTQS